MFSKARRKLSRSSTLSSISPIGRRSSCTTVKSSASPAVTLLPYEILLQIFSHVTDLSSHDLLEISLVCKAWNDAAVETLYYQPAPYTMKHQKALIRHLQRNSAPRAWVRSLALPTMNIFSQTVTQNRSSIPKLRLATSEFRRNRTKEPTSDGFIGLHPSATMFSAMVTLCPGLTELRISMDYFDMRRVTSLPRLTRCRELEPAYPITSLVLCGKRSPTLKEPGLYLQEFYLLIWNLQSLRVLSLCDILFQQEQEYPWFRTSQPRISEISLVNCSYRAAANFAHVFATNGSLRKLHLAPLQGERYDRVIGDPTLSSQRYQSLQTLRIDFPAFDEWAFPFCTLSLRHLCIIFDRVDVTRSSSDRFSKTGANIPAAITSLELRKTYFRGESDKSKDRERVLSMVKELASQATKLREFVLEWAVSSQEISEWDKIRIDIKRYFAESDISSTVMITTNTTPSQEVSCAFRGFRPVT